jgi:hypothetical protein
MTRSLAELLKAVEAFMKLWHELSMGLQAQVAFVAESRSVKRHCSLLN